MKKIDLRSDTVTLPSSRMRAALATAEVGDDVYGEDPTVNKLESIAAEKMDKEAALFVSSGTQSNLIAVLTHCQRGDEYIAGQTAHNYKYEAGGAAVLGGVQPQPIDYEPDGTLNLDKVASYIKRDDFHFAKTRLLCLENTQGGKALPLKYIEEADVFAKKHGLATYLDGARIFNAAIKLKIDARKIAQHFDSVSICLSKGLAAPVGSLLCGKTEFIKRARRWRKMLGGGMRQAGIIAAAGIIALTEMVERLEEDHLNAQRLAQGFSMIRGFHLDMRLVQTNMVFVALDQNIKNYFVPYMAEKGILIGSGHYPFRLVTHYGISAADIDFVIETAEKFIKADMSHS